MDLVLFIIVSVIGTVVMPCFLALTMRGILRQFPEARASFIADGQWISFSRRFGLRWGFAACLAGFAWVGIAMKFLPDTETGAMVLFLPAIALVIVGVCLMGLRAARWAVDEN